MGERAHDAGDGDAGDVDVFDDPRPAGRGTRVLWGLVIVLAGALLLVAVTVASVAILVPDALSGSCIRPQLVRPEECAPHLRDAADR